MLTYTTIKMPHENDQHPPRHIRARINTLKRYTLPMHIQHRVIFDLLQDILIRDLIVYLNVIACWARGSVVGNVLGVVVGAISGADGGELARGGCGELVVGDRVVLG